MDNDNTLYDCAIIGGGLAGLSLSIDLARRGISVILFEKNQYPFHRVCGEYVSMESWDYLLRLGVPLPDMGLPRINKLTVSSERGFRLHHTLDPGGFGISRFTLDDALFQIAVQAGVKVEAGSVARKVHHTEDYWQVDTSTGSSLARLVCGSFGKYTPSFISETIGEHATGKKMNYVGVKYHIRTDLDTDRIELHNFEGGYCGVSKVDQDRYCLCYLTESKNLTDHQKDIKIMEQEVLCKNPFLKEYFTSSDFLIKQPLVVSNVAFCEKHTSADGILLLGDAAGSITPLCGNGMSMAMRAADILSSAITAYFKSEITRSELVSRYQHEWSGAFHRRITMGYYLQYLFGKKNTTDLALRILSKTPGLTKKLVALTHGTPF